MGGRHKRDITRYRASTLKIGCFLRHSFQGDLLEKWISRDSLLVRFWGTCVGAGERVSFLFTTPFSDIANPVQPELGGKKEQRLTSRPLKWSRPCMLAWGVYSLSSMFFWGHSMMVYSWPKKQNCGVRAKIFSHQRQNYSRGQYLF